MSLTTLFAFLNNPAFQVEGGCEVVEIVIGTSDYWVYSTPSHVAEYMNGQLGTAAWDNASADDRLKAHVQATRWLDTMNWQGARTGTQPLDWPRTGMVNCDGTVIADDELPEDICSAIAELILVILADNSASNQASTAKNIKSLGAGSASIEFFRGGDAQGGKGTPLPTQAWRLIKCFTGAGSQASSGAIASGTDACSQFDDDDRYDLRDGEGFP